jgi:ribosomal protein L34E
MTEDPPELLWESNDIPTPGQQLAALRKKVRHVCAECGEPFEAIKTARFCSNACKQRDKYRRSKQQT